MKNLFAILLSVLLASACSDAGSVYLGEWVNTRNATDTITVSRNGDGFLVVHKAPNPFNGKITEEKYGAVLNKGMLEVQGGFGAPTFAHIEASDTLTSQGLMGSVEFKRKD